MVSHHFFYRGGEKDNMKSFNSRRGVKVKKKQRYKNKILSMFLVSIMVFSMIPIQAYSTVDSNGVEIKDEQLEKALKEEIKKINPEYNNENISKEDMELLVDVDLSNKGIKNLDGIEHAKNLKNINLEGNEITDISNLGSIEGLEKYNISKQAINISLNANEKNEAELSDVLKGIDGSKVLPTESDDISLKEDKIIFSNLEKGENIKTLEFKNSNEKGEFSGSLKVNILNESEKEVPNLNKDEANKIEDNGQNIKLDSEKNISMKNKTSTTYSLEELFGKENEGFNALIGKSYYGMTYMGHGTKNGFHDFVGFNNGYYDSSMKGALILGAMHSAWPDDYETSGIIWNEVGTVQSATVRSDIKFDFNDKIRMEGIMTVEQLTPGVAIAFHNDPTYKGNPGGALGFYKSRKLDYNEYGIENAIVAEIDPIDDYDYDYSEFGDREGLGLHVMLGSPYKNGGGHHSDPVSSSSDFNKEEFFLEWNPSSNTMTFEFGTYEPKERITYNPPANVVEHLKKNGAYLSISNSHEYVSINGRQDFSEIKANVTVTKSEKVNLNQSIEYLKADGDREIALGDGDLIRAGDVITVRHKISNKINSKKSFNGKAILDKNDFRNSRLSLVADDAGKWYTPYVIDNSFKTYIQGQSSDNTINKSDFINQREVSINIPDSSKTRVIEYKVKIPKVIGETRVELRNKLRFTNSEFEGKKVVESFRNTDTSQNVIAIEDVKLKQGLIDSVKKRIKEAYNENRPSYFDGKVYWVELQQLVEINLPNKGITSLNGIEKCKNVKTIDLSKNNIQDISKLKEIPALTTLNLSNNDRIQDVSKLSESTKLTTLNLSNNTQVSKESLGKLLNITDLTMDNARIDDSYAQVIGGLLKLTRLSLNGNSISNLSNFSNLEQLNKLYLNNNKISDLRPLRNKIESFTAENYSIKNQSVDIAESYLNSGDFKFENIVYNIKAIERNIDGAEYDAVGNKVIWRDLQEGIRSVSYRWRNENYNFTGTVNINLKQVSSPDYLVVIPSTLKMGDVLDENSQEYDPEIDKNSIQYKPTKPVTNKNPIVSGVVGAKDIISIDGNDNVVGNINIYTDSVFTMTNIKNPEDTAKVDVYKNFNDKLNGTALSKTEALLSLNNENRKKEFRIKSPSSRFKINNAEYRGTMNFIIEHVK